MRRNFEGLVRCSGLFQLPNFTSSHMMKLSNSTHVLVSLNKHSKASHMATVINNHNGLQHGLGIFIPKPSKSVVILFLRKILLVTNIHSAWLILAKEPFGEQQ